MGSPPRFSHYEAMRGVGNASGQVKETEQRADRSVAEQPPGHGDVPGTDILPELSSDVQTPEGARANPLLRGQLFANPSLCTPCYKPGNQLNPT